MTEVTCHRTDCDSNIMTICQAEEIGLSTDTGCQTFKKSRWAELPLMPVNEIRPGDFVLLDNPPTSTAEPREVVSVTLSGVDDPHITLLIKSDAVEMFFAYKETEALRIAYVAPRMVRG